MIETTSRELTYDERATFGECRVCGAKHGQWCNGNFGIQLGMSLTGKPVEHGVHLGRLQSAPKFVDFNFRRH